MTTVFSILAALLAIGSAAAAFYANSQVLAIPL